MAITIYSTPTGYPSAHQELWHVVESTNKSTAGFKYIFDIYKSNTLLARIRNSPYGENKIGILDVHNIVRSQLPNNKIVNFDPFSFDTDSTFSTDILFTDYDIRYGEISGGVLTANIASGTYRAWNNYKRPVFDKLDSEILDSQALTNRPSITKYYPGHPIVISLFYKNTYSHDRREIYNGVPINTYTAEENGVGAIFGYIPTFDNTKLEFRRLSPNVVLNTFTFRKGCTKYDPHTLLFLNAYGAWDSFTFVHGKKTIENQKKKYQSQNWELFIENNSMVNKINRVYNESSKYYTSEYSIKMQLTSDILSTAEYDWLAELVNSPQVYYLDINTEDFIPVIVTDTNYEFKDERINKADTLTVNIEFSEKTNTQFR